MGFAIVQDTFTPKIGRLAMLLQSPGRRTAFLTRWGGSIRNKARENCMKRGSSAFWRGIRDSVNVQSVGLDAVEVGSSHVAAAQKQFGGPIRARGKAAGGADALTIPIAPEAKGQSVAKFEAAGKRIFAIKRVLGYSEESGEFHPLFVLCKQTRPQKAEPWWPENDFIEAEGVKHAKAMLGIN